ncbi:MAG: acyltransferase [Capnocytophaga felis]|nr:acyltransferase [Capnocytophaga felis]
MDKYLSNKIKNIQFISIILVVLQHSFLMKEEDYFLDSFKINNFIQYFFSLGVTKVSVPLFFIISGYLFFFNSDNSYIAKCKKRIKTLLIPYVFFSIFWCLLIYIVKFFLKNETMIFDDVLKNLFGSNPIAYQLWFMRDLMILVIVSPLLFYGILKTKGYILSLFFLLWFFLPIYEPWERFRESLLFFSLGATFSITKHYKINIKIDLWKTIFITLAWIVVLTIKSIYNIYNPYENYLNHILSASSICIGIISIWGIYDFIKQNNFLQKHTQYTFIIYLLHAPITIMLIQKAIFKILGVNHEAVHIINYFASAIITVYICILSGFLLKKHAPKFYNIITGNR